MGEAGWGYLEPPPVLLQDTLVPMPHLEAGWKRSLSNTPH